MSLMVRTLPENCKGRVIKNEFRLCSRQVDTTGAYTPLISAETGSP